MKKTDPEISSIFDQAAQPPTMSEVFAKETRSTVSPEDIFAGDEKLYRLLEKHQGPTVISQAGQAAAKTASKVLTATNIILIINVIAITVILGYILVKDRSQVILQVPEDKDSTPEKTETKSAAGIAPGTAEKLDKAISWQVGDNLYRNGEYLQAYYVFERLSENLTPSIPAQEFLADFLKLKMALCLTKTDNQDKVSELITIALKSRSPVVRAMANYHLVFIENRNDRYLNTRQRAYKALALFRTVQEDFSPNLEADCYFIAAEALTKKVMSLSGKTPDLPGKLWSNSMPPESIPQMDQDQLQAFLQSGVFNISQGAIAPKIDRNLHLNVGSQWSAFCVDAPLEQVLTSFTTAIGSNMVWLENTENEKNRPATLYMPDTSQQMIGEVAAGSAGLIARFSGDDIQISNPEVYDDLEEYRQMLAKEAISAWRRFMIRYRGDHRMPNALYAIGVMQENIGQDVAALGEYKLIYSQYTNSSLAPFALLNASKLKTNMRRYTEARRDLTELIVQYPDCKLVDKASLYLADATMQAGKHEEAISMFKKVYNLDLNEDSQRLAAFGIGTCAFETKQYDLARKWLLKAISLTRDPSDKRLYPAYYMLGKSYIKLNQFNEASIALRNALASSLPTEDYVETLLQLVRAEAGQGKYVVALNIIENIPLSNLSQYYSCEVILAKSRILRDIQMAESAITLLRRQIEFIADSQLRGKLTLEMARCRIETGDLRVARQRLSQAVGDLYDSQLRNEAYLLLVEVSMKLGDNDQARDICLQFLTRTQHSEKEKQEALKMLGQVYTALNDHNRAAMAFVGLYDNLASRTELK